MTPFFPNLSSIKQIYPILWIAILNWSCNPSEVDSNTSSSRSGTSEKTSDSQSEDAGYQQAMHDEEEERVSQPQQISGSYLNCVTTIVKENVNQYSYGCSIYQDGKRINLDKSDTAVEWGAEADTSHTLYTNSKHHAIYVFDQEVSSTEKSPTLSAHVNSPTQQLTDNGALEFNLDKLFSKLGSRRYMRMALTSLNSRKSNSKSEAKRISSLEVNLNGEWLKMEPDLTNQSLRLGKYEVDLKAKPADILMTIKILSGIEVEEISSAGSYSPKPPHDYVNKPMYFLVDFGKDDVIVRGYRINGGEPMSYDEMPTGLVDKYHLELSDDALDWDIIKESEIDLQGGTKLKPIRQLN